MDGHTVDPRKLSDMPFILQNKGHAIRKMADQIFKKYKVVPQVVMETHSSLTAATMAVAGLGGDHCACEDGPDGEQGGGVWGIQHR